MKRCHQLRQCFNNIIALNPTGYAILLKEDPCLLLNTLSQAVYPPHRLEQGVHIKRWLQQHHPAALAVEVQAMRATLVQRQQHIALAVNRNELFSRLPPGTIRHHCPNSDVVDAD